MKYLVCLIFAFIAVSAFVECAPRPDFKSYEEAKQALEDAISKLNTIASKMPEDENKSDYQAITSNASFLSVLGHTMNKDNFAFLNYSHHYRKSVELIEKYKKYLN